MKKMIEADKSILDAMRYAFKAVYDDRREEATETIETPCGLLKLGLGKDHIVFGIPKEITITEPPHSIQLALRLDHSTQ